MHPHTLHLHTAHLTLLSHPPPAHSTLGTTLTPSTCTQHTWHYSHTLHLHTAHLALLPHPPPAHSTLGTTLTPSTCTQHTWHYSHTSHMFIPLSPAHHSSIPSPITSTRPLVLPLLPVGYKRNKKLLQLVHKAV